MTTAAQSATRLPGFGPLGWITGVSVAISAIGLGVWGWLVNHRQSLPPFDSQVGKALLGQYQAIAHDVVLILLALAVVALLALIQRARAAAVSSPGDAATGEAEAQKAGGLLQFAREQPIVLAIFVAYTVVMVQGTTWLYPELVGWYTDVIDDHLLNNFSIRADFIGETMGRQDYRFFPLAHQDLHVLSWFTAYVKVWMLVSAAELIAIVVLASRFIRRLCAVNRQKGPALLLISALLFMLHPATASGFFQFIYCERLLTFIFALYISAYLHHQTTGSSVSFYSTCLFGLIGIFIKDIAILLFIGPPLMILALGSLGFLQGYGRWEAGRGEDWLDLYRLELWLVGLLPIFLCSYIVLSLLPSAYANEGSYAKGGAIKIHPDWRFGLLLLVSSARLVLAAIGRVRLQLLDCLNLTGLAYATALTLLVGFQSESYLTLPVQLITVLDLTWIWGAGLAPRLNLWLFWRRTAAVGTLAALALVCAEWRFSHPSFPDTVSGIKRRQASWLGAYDATAAQARAIKQQGEPVNIIYSKISWLSRKRHLGRLHYDRLIEFNPETNTYRIEDGINRDGNYVPRGGDLVINIDNSVSSLAPILDQYPAKTLYRYDDRDASGAVFRLQPQRR